MSGAVRMVATVAAAERRRDGILWLCLADMKELGDTEEVLHRGLAGDILALGPNIRVMLYGERMKWLAQELEKHAIKSSGFLSQEQMAAELKQHLKPTDFILLKGSRSMRMEKVWEAIKA